MDIEMGCFYGSGFFNHVTLTMPIAVLAAFLLQVKWLQCIYAMANVLRRCIITATDEVSEVL